MVSPWLASSLASVTQSLQLPVQSGLEGEVADGIRDKIKRALEERGLAKGHEVSDLYVTKPAEGNTLQGWHTVNAKSS